MKRIFIIWLMAVALPIVWGASQKAEAQNIGEWKVYPSYQNATQNVVAGTMVYSLMDGNLLRYDTEDESVKTYDCLNDINDVHINYIAYCAAAKRLVLVYDNQNIDLLDTDDRVLNIASLKDKTLTDKEVTSIYVDEKCAYLTTGFGLVKLNVAEGTVLDTYKLGFAAKGMLIQNGKVYVATDKDVRSCALDANWHETRQWTVSSEVSRNAILTQDDGYHLAGGLYWHSDGFDGLCGYKKQADGSYEKVAGPITANSPRRDLFYRMHYDVNGQGGYRLLVAGGINTFQGIYYPATAMLYDEDEWSYLDETTPKEQYAKLNHWNTTDVVQDPTDPQHIFASPYRTGLYEYRDGKFVALYNCDNSPLESILPNIAQYRNYVSATCLQYDAEGNLWMCNQETDTIVRVLTADKKWRALYYSEIEGSPQCDGYLFHSSGINFLVSRRYTGKGFFGFDTKGTLTNTRTHQHKLYDVITNQDGTSYSPNNFYCMTEDLEGHIWCGTELGLFLIENPSAFFDDNFTFTQVKIARNDGSGLADYLLNGVDIRCITVDGANRKWIGTEGNGIYLVSADGQELIQHFTADDSPLLSNNIQCIAVHPVSGLVMIGTSAGLCSYMSDATTAEEELKADNVLAFPNPITPDYSGPIRIEGLTFNAEVKILSSAGQLIWSGVSNGGTCVWNGCDKRGKRVASGVYHVVSNTANGKKAVVTRIIMIK